MVTFVTAITLLLVLHAEAWAYALVGLATVVDVLANLLLRRSK